jgi:adenylate kinase family enzyme
MVSPVRINVTGNAGAGKTTLAHAVGAAFELPVFSLDPIVWMRGWRKRPSDERAILEQALVRQPVWVIDGVSQRVRDAADLVIFLDVSRPRCLVRALARSLRNLSTSRPGLPPGCPEWRIVPRLARIIWQFPGNAGRTIRAEAAARPERFHIPGPGTGFAELMSSVRTALSGQGRPDKA